MTRLAVGQGRKTAGDRGSSQASPLAPPTADELVEQYWPLKEFEREARQVVRSAPSVPIVPPRRFEKVYVIPPPPPSPRASTVGVCYQCAARDVPRWWVRDAWIVCAACAEAEE